MKLSHALVWLMVLVIPRLAFCKSRDPVYAVMLVNRVINTGKLEAASVEAHAILPADNKYQDVFDMSTDPEEVELQFDGEGQKSVKVSFGSLGPGHTRAIRALLWIKPKSARVRLSRGTDDVEELLPIQIAGHTSDGPLLQLDKVRPIARKAVGAKTRDIDKARALYDYMSRYCRYNIDRTEIAADAVLAGEPASCSELAMTYTAMCRSLDIPARLITAYVNRGELATSIDWQLHRWSEFYADGIGWVPVDPTNKINNPKKKFFAQQFGKYLAVVDDGVPLIERPDPAWMVFGVRSEPAKNVVLELGKSAVWSVSTYRTLESEFFKEACRQLNDADPSARLEAVKQWQRKRLSLKRAFFLEALFDADARVRKAAAQSFGRDCHVSFIIPLMLIAEREKDPDVKDTIIAVVEKKLDSREVEKRTDVIGELAKSRTAQALELLKDLWGDPEDDVRKKVAYYLYKFGDKPEVHKAYGQLAEDKDDFIRLIAATRWARTGSKEGISEVVKHLESSIRWDREKALAEIVRHTRDDFGFNPRIPANNSDNRRALRKFQDWIEKLEDKK